MEKQEREKNVMKVTIFVNKENVENSLVGYLSLFTCFYITPS